MPSAAPLPGLEKVANHCRTVVESWRYSGACAMRFDNEWTSATRVSMFDVVSVLSWVVGVFLPIFGRLDLRPLATCQPSSCVVVLVVLVVAVVLVVVVVVVEAGVVGKLYLV